LAIGDRTNVPTSAAHTTKIVSTLKHKYFVVPILHSISTNDSAFVKYMKIHIISS
jgi:hypothetical protein